MGWDPLPTRQGTRLETDVSVSTPLGSCGSQTTPHQTAQVDAQATQRSGSTQAVNRWLRRLWTPSCRVRRVMFDKDGLVIAVFSAFAPAGLRLQRNPMAAPIRLAGAFSASRQPKAPVLSEPGLLTGTLLRSYRAGVATARSILTDSGSPRNCSRRGRTSGPA